MRRRKGLGVGGEDVSGSGRVEGNACGVGASGSGLMTAAAAAMAVVACWRCLCRDNNERLACSKDDE